MKPPTGRNNRSSSRDFRQPQFRYPVYAIEELVAELSVAFIGANIGLPADHLEDCTTYIGNCLKALSVDPSAFLTAASRAQATADFVLRSIDVESCSDPGTPGH